MPRFVQVRGGAYFFLPGITAIRYGNPPLAACLTKAALSLANPFQVNALDVAITLNPWPDPGTTPIHQP